jgi:DNA-binding NarL/FixJ family response regulator
MDYAVARLDDVHTGPRAGTAAIRIVIADEFPIFRDGLRRLLERGARLRIVGEGGVAAAAPLVCELQPDVLLLGSRTSDRLAETLRPLAGAGVAVRTILLAQSIDSSEVAHALEIGASGVIAKDSAPELLLSCIDTVMAGEYWVGQDCAKADVHASVRRLDHARRQAQGFGLTRRELEIVRAVANGDTNREIAAGLSISQNTVKRHLMHIFNKVGASSRVELALFASHHRLLEGI